MPEPSIIYGLRLSDSSEYRYIGQTTMPGRRMYLHRWNAGNESPKLPVHKWMKKYLEEVVMDTIETIETGNHPALNAAEVHHIAERLARGDRLLNMTDGGDAVRGYVATVESRAAHSERMTGAGNPRFGTTWSPELREKIMANMPDQSGEKSPRFGKTNSAEYRAKLSENHHDVNGTNNPFFGKSHSDETHEKMRAWHAQRRADLESGIVPRATRTPEMKAAAALLYANRTPEQIASAFANRSAAQARRTPEQIANATAKSNATKAANKLRKAEESA